MGLIRACKKGHLSIVKLLIGKKIESKLSTFPPVKRDKIKSEYWNDGLYYACKRGYLPIVQFLIDKGANNLNEGLEIANKNKHLEIINYLSKLLKIEI